MAVLRTSRFRLAKTALIAFSWWGQSGGSGSSSSSEDESLLLSSDTSSSTGGGLAVIDCLVRFLGGIGVEFTEDDVVRYMRCEDYSEEGRKGREEEKR